MKTRQHTPEEMKNELRYLRAENAYLKVMQEHLLEKSARSWRKRKSSGAWRCGHCQFDLVKALQGWPEVPLYYQLSPQKAKDKYVDVKQLIASIFHMTGDVMGTGGSIVSFRKRS